MWTPILLVVGTVVTLYIFYRVIRYFLPGWGTMVTNGLVAVAALTEVLQGLPWSSVLKAEQVGWVLMGIAIVNGLMRMTPSKADPVMLPGRSSG